ncbi:MAG: guanylate kinase [Omnitrophica bacterium RBG_13_46_9]|nr:MAG: guanylate kinase [Omnitrophica bacterium RBG_13_46_9]
MNRKGQIFVISAPSGSGKTTICKRVLRRIKSLTPSISVTTRHPRPGEKNKKDYHYISVESFKKKIEEESFFEWTENFGYFYGTPKGFILENIRKGKNLLLSIDMKGAAHIKRKFPDSVLIFIKPPSLKELSHRLRRRASDGKAEIVKRLRKAKKELSYASRYDYVVINNRLDDAVDEVVSIIRKEINKDSNKTFEKLIPA